MAGRSKVTKTPRCTALLKDGSTCRTWAVADGLCEHHFDAREAAQPEPGTLDSIEESPPEAMASPKTGEPVELELPPAAEEALNLAPGQVRGQLAADLGAGYAGLIRVLREAMNADGERWVTCTNCQKRGVYLGPDYKVRLDAAARWVELGLGKAAQAPEEKTVDLSEIDVSKMGRSERNQLLAEICQRHPELAKRHASPPPVPTQE